MQIKPYHNHYKPIEKPARIVSAAKKQTPLPDAPKKDDAKFEKPAARTFELDDGAIVVSLSVTEQAPLQDAPDEAQLEKDAAREEQLNAIAAMGTAEKATQTGGSKKVSDESGQLTRRLVAAISQFEVQQIIGEASKYLIELRLSVAMAQGDDAKAARAVIRRLEKVVRRGHRKITDLGKEDNMRLKQTRAERQHKRERAQEIKKELREHIRKRKEREKKYLREYNADQPNYQVSGMKLDAAAEAQIAVQAQMQASMEAAAPVSGGGEAGAGATGAAGETGATGAVGAAGASSGSVGGEVTGGGMEGGASVEAEA